MLFRSLGVPAASREEAEAAVFASSSAPAAAVSGEQAASNAVAAAAAAKKGKTTREGVVKPATASSATVEASACKRQVWPEFRDLFHFDELVGKGGSLLDVFLVSAEEDVVAERAKLVKVEAEDKAAESAVGEDMLDVDVPVEGLDVAEDTENVGVRQDEEMAKEGAKTVDDSATKAMLDDDIPLKDEDGLVDAAETTDAEALQVLETAPSAESNGILDSERIPVTPLAFSLLQSMLTMDPQQRPLASQLLHHPYFAEYPPLIDRDSYIALYGNKYGQEEWHELRFR